MAASVPLVNTGLSLSEVLNILPCVNTFTRLCLPFAFFALLKCHLCSPAKPGPQPIQPHDTLLYMYVQRQSTSLHHLHHSEHDAGDLATNTWGLSFNQEELDAQIMHANHRLILVKKQRTQIGGIISYLQICCSQRMQD